MYPSTNYDLNGHVTTQDIRLSSAQMPNWQVGTKQRLFSSHYTILEPTSKIEPIPIQVEFELPTYRPILFGPMTKFRISGSFQVKEDDDSEWAAVPNADEAEKVLLAPFWFEMLLKEVAVFHQNKKVSSSSEIRSIAPFLHAYLHANMEPTAKKLLCPQAEHPAYCLPEKNEKWNFSSAGWKKYASSIFKGPGAINFEYTPLFLFPFYQGKNFMMDQEGVPRLLPMPSLGRIQIRFTFHDDQNRIFQKKLNNKSQYRFVFSDFNLMVEQAYLNPTIEKPLPAHKKTLAYPGITRLQLVETIPDSSTAYRARFQDIFMPESIFIFCLNKQVANGSYSFAREKNPNIFLDHNIQSVEIMFNKQRLATREPHLGTIHLDELDSKQLFDHIFNPPFGICQDITLLTHTDTAEGSKLTAFPHIYIPLTNGPHRQRIVPSQSSGSAIMKRAHLDIDLKFTDNNSTSSSVYIIYACYTDVNMVYDYANNVFYSPYLPHMN